MNPLFIKSEENWELAEYCLENDKWLSSGVSRAYYSVFQNFIVLLERHKKPTRDSMKKEDSHIFVKNQVINLLLEKEIISEADMGDIILTIDNMKYWRVKADYRPVSIVSKDLNKTLDYGKSIKNIVAKL